MNFYSMDFDEGNGKKKKYELVGFTLVGNDSGSTTTRHLGYAEFLCLAGTHDCGLNARLSIEAGFADFYCLKTFVPKKDQSLPS